MAVTPNYNWPLPDDTSLVKDGAEAIRDLGNAIDTTVEDIPLGGLIHINSTALDTVAAININNVFSATFDNYKIVINCVSTSTTSVRARLRVAGVDNTTASSYTSQQIIGISNTASAESVVDTFFNFGNANTDSGIFEITLAKPFETDKTVFTSFGGRNDRANMTTGFHNQSISFDGVTFTAGTGTLTGTINIYGLAN